MGNSKYYFNIDGSIGYGAGVGLDGGIAVPTGSNQFLADKIKINCNGNVEEIYRQKMNHNILALKIKNCILNVPWRWETKFLVGDSISKKEGELFVEHYRNGELIEVLDYRDIAKEMKDDDWDIMWRRLKEKINIAKDKEH